jgi:predicted CXXCH cytochrome family protein
MVRRRYTHGPVTSRQCDECHAPHESPFASLLVRRGDDLCLYCHGEETIVEGAKVMRLAGGSHVNFPKEDCTGCHDPHGSDVSATLLKPGVPLPSEGAKTP